uniref:Uncharacterized protein n=1 Tax=Mus spicilegus TaxID=10103 RepID=A0A8C6I8S2_MUSSI
RLETSSRTARPTQRNPVSKKKIVNRAGRWWHTPLIPALGSTREAEAGGFLSSRPAWFTK